VYRAQPQPTLYARLLLRAVRRTQVVAKHLWSQSTSAAILWVYIHIILHKCILGAFGGTGGQFAFPEGEGVAP